MRDTGDLAAAGRGPKLSTMSDTINHSPVVLPEALVRLRFNVRGATSLQSLVLI